ncbi:MAG: tyrosine-type recombinase/integrase [Gammaproteobacteria bacterium]|nr:tyrosine-type recombinase/integrase [Gammaproteobacteria bacterium]
MFEKFFDRIWRVNAIRNGPSGPLLVGFAEKLYQKGYAEITARKHIRAAEHLIYWTDGENMPLSSLTEEFSKRFDRHLCQCRCQGFGHSNRLELVNGARLFLKHLRSTGVITAPIVEPTTQDPNLLISFRQWMHQQRGTSDATLSNYSHPIRSLLRRLGEDPVTFDAQGLRQFVLEKSQKCGWAAAKTCTTALRMFLRFLIAEGKCATDLEAAIPVLAHWRLSSLPQYLQPEEIERIISSCKPNSMIGRRNRAILLLLARMALRAGDIVQLRLSDIDWKEAEIQVSGKGGRQTRLPLTQEVGDALVAYLQNGRPPTETDRLFVRSRAPFHAFSSHSAVSVMVSQAMRRAGVTCLSRGAAHVLRHSAATAMLRQGASLQEIANILRHLSIETTQIYAKVDIAALRQIAQPWPGV